MNHKEHQGHQEVRDADGLARLIVDAGLKVHKALGPGLLESAYEQCLAHELVMRGVPIRRQVPLPVAYEGLQVEAGYRLDLVADDLIIIEVKAVEAFSRLHEAQILTYLKLSGLRLGLLMNFNVPMFRQGARRFAL